MRSLVYSLELEVERFCPRTTQRLIVPVDQQGRSPACRAHDRGKRLVDLVPGDWIVHHRRRYRIKTVASFGPCEVASELGDSSGVARGA
jgi:hypothetical protein